MIDEGETTADNIHGQVANALAAVTSNEHEGPADPACTDAKVAMVDIESTVDDDFASAFVSPALLSDCEVDTASRPKPWQSKALAIGALGAIGCGLALTARRSSTGARVLLMACLGSALSSPTLSEPDA